MNQIRQTASFPLLGVISLAITSFMGATLYSVGKGLFEEFNPIEIVVFRFLSGALVLLAIQPKLVLSLSKAKIKKILPTAATLSFSFIMVWKGTKSSATGLSAFLANSEFVLIPIFAYFFFKQTISSKNLALVLLGLVGIGLLCIDKDFTITTGVIYLLCSAIGFAFYLILNSELTKEISKLELTFLTLLFAGIFSILPAYLEGLTFNFNQGNFLALIYLGPICTGVRFYFMTYGQSKVKVSQTGLIYLCEPIGASLIGYYFLNEVFSINQLIGVFILVFTVVGGIYLVKNEAVV